MQILERSAVGLRSARMVLTAPGKPSFTLFPMVHLADRAFFDRVRADANDHDLVLREGVQHRLGRAAGRMHWLATCAANGLSAEGRIVQGFGAAHWRNSDIDPGRFDEKISKVPWWIRTLIYVVSPILGLILRSRRARLWLMDLGDGERDTAETLERIGGRAFREAIMDDRDKALADHCDRAIAENEAGCIAVIWGAGHMQALIEHLTRTHGYQITDRSWMMVIKA